MDQKPKPVKKASNVATKPKPSDFEVNTKKQLDKVSQVAQRQAQEITQLKAQVRTLKSANNSLNQRLTILERKLMREI